MVVPDVLSKTWTFLTAMIRPDISVKGEMGDGREEKLLKYVLETAETNAESVMKSMDKFGHRFWLMNIGDEKGRYLDEALTERNPKVVLELGGYLGYSAVRIACQLKGDSKLISVEMNPRNAEIAEQIIAHAGLSEKVTIVVGTFQEKMQEVQRLLYELDASTFDFVFIDHDKDMYLPDYLTLKENGLVGAGSVLFADNMLIPGAPKYRNHILNTNVSEFDTVEHKTGLEYFRWLPDSVLISTIK